MTRVCNGDGRAAAVLVALAAMIHPEVASAEVVTLDQLEEAALQNRARWEAVEATTKRAEAEVRVARAGLRPSFALTADGLIAPGGAVEQVRTVDGRVVNVRASPTVRQARAFRPNVRYDTTIAMRAPLYDGQSLASIKAAEAYREAAGAGSKASRQEMLIEVRLSYLDWVAADREHALSAAMAQEAASQRERVAARVVDGDAPASDLDSARHRELQAQLDAADAEARLADARQEVESAIGRELPSSAQPDLALLAIDSGPSDTAAALAWDAKALERESHAARREAKQHLRARAPVLAVVGQSGFAGINQNVFPMYELGVSLAVPLWDGGRAAALAHAAEARAVELEARARDTELQDRDAREKAVTDRAQAEQQLQLADALVVVSERRVEQAQTSYDLGDATLDSVSDARDLLRKAQSRRVQIQVMRAEAVLRLR